LPFWGSKAKVEILSTRKSAAVLDTKKIAI